MKTSLVFEGLLEVQEDGQAGSVLQLWSHVHFQCEHEASRHICQCCDTKFFFITIKLSHWWTSKLVDWLHSCRVTWESGWKQNDARCFSESRLRDKWTHRSSHCSPPPPLFLMTSPALCHFEGSVGCQSRASSCKKQDCSHVGLIKFSQSHTASPSPCCLV